MFSSNRLVFVALFLIAIITEVRSSGSEQKMMAIKFLPIVPWTGEKSNKTIVVQPMTSSAMGWSIFAAFFSKKS
jgi:hypothetical protein